MVYYNVISQLHQDDIPAANEVFRHPKPPASLKFITTKILPELIAVKAAYAYVLVSFHKTTELMLVQTSMKKKDPSSLHNCRRFLQRADTPAGPRIV